MQVLIGEKLFATCTNVSKKMAEKICAEQALTKLKVNEKDKLC